MVGISGITNRFSVVPSESVTDKWIAEDIQRALNRDASVEAERITAAGDGRPTADWTLSVFRRADHRIGPIPAGMGNPPYKNLICFGVGSASPPT